jgi:short-subunit dehydrogenase
MTSIRTQRQQRFLSRYGPWAVVTGASSGIGRALACRLAEALQVELQQDGVDVLAAAPGLTHSGFAARAGQRLGTALQPDAVAQPILDALGRQATVLPGFLSKLLTMSLVPLARWVRVRIMGNVMRGMSQPPFGIAGAAG